MAAPLTGANLPSQSGKVRPSLPLLSSSSINHTQNPLTSPTDLSFPSAQVFIVTGASGGLGAALTSILYAHHARIYVAARSHSKASATIAAIAAQHPSSKGSLVYLHLDLDDLRTIKASAQQFLDAEERLDVLWNNAGCMLPAPERARTSQGWERQLGVNAMGPALFTMCLRDVLARTAGREGVERNQVRVVWVSSNMSTWAPRPAVDLGNMRYERAESADTKYMRSKAGTNFLAVEFQRRVVGEGVVSVVCMHMSPSSPAEMIVMGEVLADQIGENRSSIQVCT